jgi:phosphatidylinositol alpha-1,6-mannosyltransferase
MTLTKTPICDFGKKAENFQLNSTDNKIISLNDIKGEKGTLIMFICNHCPYVKAVIELDLKGQVIFLKDITHDLKNALVAQSNVFVMPSIIYKKSVEGFGIAYVEAAQYGIPSIGGKDGGAADAIDHEKTGLICDGNELNEVYSSIKNLLKDKKHIEYGKNAEINSLNFTWDKVIENYKRIL